MGTLDTFPRAIQAGAREYGRGDPAATGLGSGTILTRVVSDWLGTATPGCVHWILLIACVVGGAVILLLAPLVRVWVKLLTIIDYMPTFVGLHIWLTLMIECAVCGGSP